MTALAKRVVWCVTVLGITSFADVSDAGAAPGDISTVAGGSVNDGGPATEAAFGGPWGVFVDPGGNIFVADWRDKRIRRIDASTKRIETVAGTGEEGVPGEGEGRPAKQSRIEVSQSVSVGPSGSIYFSGSRIIRRVDPEGILRNVAGFGVDQREGAPALSAPGGRTVFVDTIGNVYFSDQHRVRRIDGVTRTVETVIGSGARGFGGDGGPARDALMNATQGVFVDEDGSILVADQNNQRIRRQEARTGVLRTLAGNGTRGFAGDGGSATGATLNTPRGIYKDRDGSLYIADVFNHRVRKVDPSGTITTFAGTGEPGFSGDSGRATETQLFGPMGVWGDMEGNIYIADRDNQRIRKVTPAGDMTTAAGGYLGDGRQATEAALNFPMDVFAASNGDLVIADSRNHRVRIVSGETGTIRTLAGGGVSTDVEGRSAREAALGEVRRVAVDGSGEVFFLAGDYVWKVSTSGVIFRIAGTAVGSDTRTGRAATETALSGPDGLCFDAEGNLYVADTGNHRVLQVDHATGIVEIFAGVGESGFSGDGGPAPAAHLSGPRGLFVSSAGDVFVADTENGRIRRIDAVDGTIATVAGAGPSGRVTDGGLAREAAIGAPSDVFVDSAGDLFISQAAESTLPIRKVDAATGVITTVAGTGAKHFFGDGGPATASAVWAPQAVHVDANGDLFIADMGNSRIRRVEAVATPTRLVAGTYSGPASPSVGLVSPPDGAAVRRSDLDGSGRVDFADFVVFAVSFGRAPGDPDFDPGADLDDDGLVGFSDFVIFAQSFGRSTS